MGEVIDIEGEEALREYLNQDGRVIIKFTAPAWCAPCRAFAPHYRRAASELPEITFLSVDVDDNPWAMVAFGIRSVPTVKLYENGTLVKDIPVPMPAIKFIDAVKE